MVQGCGEALDLGQISRRDPGTRIPGTGQCHPMIQDKRPIDLVIQNEIGAEMVVDILGSLKYGSAA